MSSFPGRFRYCAGVAAQCQTRRIIYEARVERRQFNQPLAGFPLIQAMLSDSRAEYAAECMLRDVAQRHDRSKRVSFEATCATAPLSGFICDVRVFRIMKTATQTQQRIIVEGMIKQFAVVQQ